MAPARRPSGPDLAVGAEDDDADIVLLEVERHAGTPIEIRPSRAIWTPSKPKQRATPSPTRQDLPDLRDLGLIAEPT